MTRPARESWLPATLAARGDEVLLRRAIHDDVAAIVGLLSADPLGALRDGAIGAAELEPYLRAFETIDGDPAHVLLVACRGARVLATMQLSFVPGMARRGGLRAQLESVHVDEECRGDGLGTAMVEWAIGVARLEGCALVQLTSDNTRSGAHRFYERLGFVASHQGYKMVL